MFPIASLNGRAKTALCLLSAVALAFLLKYPFFSYAVLNWDESTWLIYGRLLSDGYPLTEISDNNMPVLFWVYAFLVKIGGVNLIFPRVLAFALVSVSACIIFLSHRRIAGENGRAGPLFSALFLVICASDPLRDGFTLMKEVLNLPFLCFAVFFLSCSQRGRGISFAAGFCLAVAVLVYPSTAFFAFAVFMFFLFSDFRKQDGIAKTVAFIAGGFVSLAIFFATDDNLEYTAQLLRVLSAGIYAEKDAFELISLIAEKLFTYVDVPVWLLVFLLPLVSRAQERFWMKRYGVFILCFLLAFYLQGNFYGHHLISISPMLALMAGMSAGALWKRPARLAKAGVALAVFCCVFSFGYHSFYKTRVLKYNSRMNLAYEAADYLNDRNVKGKYVYFLRAHLGYLLTGAAIPTKYIHPSMTYNTQWQRGFEGDDKISGVTQMERIFSKRPVFVVTQRHESMMDDDQRRFVARKLVADYKLVKIIPDLYKRRKDNKKDLLIYERKGAY